MSHNLDLLFMDIKMWKVSQTSAVLFHKKSDIELFKYVSICIKLYELIKTNSGGQSGKSQSSKTCSVYYYLQ